MQNNTQQLREDLMQRVDEKLRRWARDSVDLYDMADLSKHDAAVDLFTVALLFLVEGTALLKLDPNHIGTTIVEGVARFNRQQKELDR